MTDWSEKFNALTYEVRNIAHHVELQHRMDAMQEARRQLKQLHAKRLHELDAEIRRLEREIAKGDA